jgi:hypothetical protein
MTMRAYNLLEVFVEVMAYIGSVKRNIWTYQPIIEFPDWLFVIVNKNLNFAYCIAFAFYIHRLFAEHARGWSQYYSICKLHREVERYSFPAKYIHANKQISTQTGQTIYFHVQGLSPVANPSIRRLPIGSNCFEHCQMIGS